ncbi:heme peroxidase [Tricladium varicosporioides]|nr:heme peroxidase [Hymenoscyphus varicosporioides]
MRCFSLLLAISVITPAHGLTISEVSNSVIPPVKRTFSGLAPRKNKCPDVWKSVVADLSTMFVDTSNGQCNDAARAAIRAAFHDCGTWSKSQGDTGGCDGSLILANEISLRPRDNNGLQDIGAKLTTLKSKYNTQITMADLLAVAASVAIVSCPGGPRIDTYVGRKDSTTPSPENMLPSPFTDAETIYRLFKDKGFDAEDLAALLGAHSVSRAVGLSGPPGNIPVGGAQDSTPGKWDVNYYAETTKNTSNVFSFPSDRALAVHDKVGKEFGRMVGNKRRFDDKFVNAMENLMLLGVPGGKSKLIDCTDFVPKGSQKREFMGRAVN